MPSKAAQLHEMTVVVRIPIKDIEDVSYHCNRTVQVDLEARNNKEARDLACRYVTEALDQYDLEHGEPLISSIYSVNKQGDPVDHKGKPVSILFDYWCALDQKDDSKLVLVDAQDPFKDTSSGGTPVLPAPTGTSKSTKSLVKTSSKARPSYTPLEPAFTDAVLEAIAAKDSLVEYDKDNHRVQFVSTVEANNGG